MGWINTDGCFPRESSEAPGGSRTERHGPGEELSGAGETFEISELVFNEPVHLFDITLIAIRGGQDAQGPRWGTARPEARCIEAWRSGLDVGNGEDQFCRCQ